MKFAFSTLACPGWDWATIATRAKDYGYDGVEIAVGDDMDASPNNILRSELAKVKSLFTDQNIEVACLSSAIAMTEKKRLNEQAAIQARQLIDLAALLGCRLVKVLDREVRPGHSREKARLALADWLAPLGDFAAERKVTLLLENALSFRSAREIWIILERLQHPEIACCWNILNAAMIGERAVSAVPTLNSRISYLQLTDAKLTANEIAFCALGDGDLQVEEYLHRLRGIGYNGWICFEWNRAAMPALAEPEIMLPSAIQKLHKWTKPHDAKRTLKPGKQPVNELSGMR
jgi:sugar phosphate isomerase/epimerase